MRCVYCASVSPVRCTDGDRQTGPHCDQCGGARLVRRCAQLEPADSRRASLKCITHAEQRRLSAATAPRSRPRKAALGVGGCAQKGPFSIIHAVKAVGGDTLVDPYTGLYPTNLVCLEKVTPLPAPS
ncbi:hypothetical protein MTO96_009085 [Rhipicephalus appendiculatus]